MTFLSKFVDALTFNRYSDVRGHDVTGPAPNDDHSWIKTQTVVARKDALEVPKPQIPGPPPREDDAWKLKLRILRQQLVEEQDSLDAYMKSPVDQYLTGGKSWGLQTAIEKLDEMLGQDEEERLKLWECHQSRVICTCVLRFMTFTSRSRITTTRLRFVVTSGSSFMGSSSAN